jgi:hypothetical protein
LRNLCRHARDVEIKCALNVSARTTLNALGLAGGNDANLPELVGYAESSARISPSDIVAHYSTRATFDAGVVRDFDLILLPSEHVGRATTNAGHVKRALHTHLSVFHPKVRYLIDLPSIAV